MNQTLGDSAFRAKVEAGNLLHDLRNALPTLPEGTADRYHALNYDWKHSSTAAEFSAVSRAVRAILAMDIFPTYVKDMETGKSLRVDREAMRNAHTPECNAANDRSPVEICTCPDGPEIYCNGETDPCAPGTCAWCDEHRTAQSAKTASRLARNILNRAAFE